MRSAGDRNSDTGGSLPVATRRVSRPEETVVLTLQAGENPSHERGTETPGAGRMRRPVC
jgi:hypothetical protein